jgi:dCTP deaminase
MERVEIPPDLIAHVQGRSSIGRLAVVVHATAGIVDPGYRGQITLELSNLGTAPVALKPGTRISQLIFTELTRPAERPYGSERGSKYQDQSGPQASRIQGDEEFRRSKRTEAQSGDESGSDRRRGDPP